MHYSLVPPAWSLAMLALTLLSACDVTIKDGDVSFVKPQGQASHEWNRTYPLSAGGRVEVVSVNGPVDVGVGQAGTVQVAALLTARAMTESRAKEILSETAIEESATPDHIRLETARRNRSTGPGALQVRYKITVPPDARVELTMTNGPLTVDGVRGHVKAMVVNGSIDMTQLGGSVDVAAVNGSITAKLASVTARVRLEGNHGGITLELPKDAKAVLSARTINGGIEVNGLPSQEVSGRRIRNFETALNGGGPEIDLRMTNGRIAITGR